MEILLREGKKSDMPSVLELIKELATFENEEDAVEVSVEELLRDGFGCLVAVGCFFLAAGRFCPFFLGFPSAPKLMKERNFCQAVGFGCRRLRDRFRLRFRFLELRHQGSSVVLRQRRQCAQLIQRGENVD